MKTKTFFLVFLSFLFITGGSLRAEKEYERWVRLKSKLDPVGLRSSVSQSTQSVSYALQPELYVPRTGDHLIKLEASYLFPGDPGDNVVWDFNHLQLSGTEYDVDYLNHPSSRLTGVENSSMNQYVISGDSLLLRGQENPLHLIRLEKPEVIMVFPAKYGDERTSYFYGKGKYCDRLELDVAGFSYTRVDGSGTLILPENDTIANALRVHSIKLTLTDSRPVSPGFDIKALRETPLTYDDILSHLEQDTIYTVTEAYRWYSEGSRYPVLECIQTWNELNGKAFNKQEKTYVYHPVDQKAELPLDTANLALLEKKDKKDPELRVTTGKEKLEVSALEIKTYPNPVVKDLYIDIQSDHQVEAELFVYSLQGQLLFKQEFQVQAGTHVEAVDMSRLAKGSYVLQVQAGNKSEKKVIVK